MPKIRERAKSTDLKDVQAFRGAPEEVEKKKGRSGFT